MKEQSTRTVANYRVMMIALAVLGVSGWGGFVYVSVSAARTERALQGEIARLNADRTGTAAVQKQQGEQPAASRTVYPSPYGTSASTPMPIVPAAARPATPSTASAQSSAPVTEPATAEQRVAPAPSAVSVPLQPSSSSAQTITAELATPDAQDAKRMDSTTPEASDLKLVDINTASVEELNRLGGRFGRAIVTGRPYASVDDLVSKRVLTRSTFTQIKDQITAN
jgi:DNA uptake protein ComE-like DNA-binding protein